MAEMPKLTAVTIALLVSVGCASYRLTSDYDRDVNFNEYKTYDWLPISTREDSSEGVVKNTMVDKRFKSSISDVLKEKGYRISPQDPDFFIAYHAAIKDKTDASSSYSGYFHHGHFGHHGYSYDRSGFYSNYDEATLIIDIIDADSLELLWRGWDRTRVSGPSIPEDKISNGTEKILRNFPPKDK